MSIKEVIIRLVLAMIVGGVIGSERERNNHPAGIKTHILVTIGSCLVSIASVFIMERAKADILTDPTLKDAIKIDIGRMSAQVISGIGFLGAGTILHSKGSITGLTTAATLWVTGCIGLCVGFGMYSASIIGTVLVMIIMVILKFVQSKMEQKYWLKELEVTFTRRADTLQQIESYFENKSVRVKSIVYIATEKNTDEKGERVYKCRYYIVMPRNLTLFNVINNLYMNDNILNVIERNRKDSKNDIDEQTKNSPIDD